MRKNIPGFTLAEVLVTLAVIGVVAALTIPAIINNADNAGNATGAKQAFSIFSEVGARLAIDEGGNLSGNCFVGQDSQQAFDCIKPYLNLIKICIASTGCWYNDGQDKPYKYLNGSDMYNFDEDFTAKAVLSNGMSIRVHDQSNDCSTDFGDGPVNFICSDVYIDVNGKAGPNTLGKDVFHLFITRSGEVAPGGSFYFDSDLAQEEKCSDWTKSCNPSGPTGEGCLARILREGEINY